MRVLRSISVVAGVGLVTSALGYLLEVVLAARFGASAETDAYFAAFFAPNTLTLILVSGSVSTVFIPVFLDYLRRDREEADRLLSAVISVSLLGLSAVVAISLATVPLWMPIIFPGYHRATLSLSISLSWILLPMLVFTGLAAVVSAALNAVDHFLAPALAPALCNALIIGAILLSPRLGGIYMVAVGVLLGVIIQFAIQVPTLKRLGFSFRPNLALRHPGMLRIGQLLLPLLAYLTVAYASVIVERVAGSALGEGTISALNFALRLFVLPSSLLAGSLGTVLYPRFARQAAALDHVGLSQGLTQAVGTAVLVLLPASLWMAINSQFIVSLLYGHGRFTAENAQLTSAILSGYALGLAPFGIVTILQRASCAVQDTTSPLWVECVNLVVYTATAVALTRRWGAGGLAVARTLSFGLVAVLLIGVLSLRRRLPVKLGHITGLVAAFGLASVPAIVVWLAPLWLARTGVASPALVISCGVLGLALYLVSVRLLNLDQTRLLETVWHSLRQKKTLAL